LRCVVRSVQKLKDKQDARLGKAGFLIRGCRLRTIESRLAGPTGSEDLWIHHGFLIVVRRKSLI